MPRAQGRVAGASGKTLFCLSQPATNKPRFSERKKKKSLSCAKPTVWGRPPVAATGRFGAHASLCTGRRKGKKDIDTTTMMVHATDARAGRSRGQRKESGGGNGVHRPRRGGSKHGQADPTAAASFFHAQCASLSLSPRARKETSKRALWLSGARHTRIPAAGKACNRPHETPPKRRRRGRPPPNIKSGCSTFFFLKTSWSGRSRCRCAGATQRRRPPCWTRRRSACGACGFPKTNTRPVLSASLGPTSRLPRKRTTQRRREPKGLRPATASSTARQATPNKRAWIDSGQIRPCRFVYSRR